MNQEIFFWFYDLGQRTEVWPVFFVAAILPWCLFFGLLVWVLFAKNKPRAFLVVMSSLLAAVIAWFLASLYKYNFVNPRPFEVLDISPLVSTSLGEAWPSGHAIFFSALAVALWFQKKSLGLIFAIGALLIGLARIAAGVHWPFDILAGWLFGGLVGFGLIFLFQRFVSHSAH